MASITVKGMVTETYENPFDLSAPIRAWIRVGPSNCVRVPLAFPGQFKPGEQVEITITTAKS